MSSKGATPSKCWVNIVDESSITDMTTRRKFVGTSAAIATGIVAGKMLMPNSTSSSQFQGQSQGQSQSPSPVPATMPERVLGNTGVSVPILGLGGAGQTPLSGPGRERAAIALIEEALLLGLRYFDTAASYGPSEDYLGKVLPNYRENVFIASKTAILNRDGAWAELERSLKRLNTDYLDLWQLHHISFVEEIDQMLGRNGVVRAIEEAKEQKVIRFCGITGHHDPGAIAQALRRYPFDTCLIPVNAADPHHPRPFIPAVLPVAQAKNVGVIAMKVPAYGRLFKPGVLDGMHQAFGYTLSQPGVCCAVIAAENPAQLKSNVKVARSFQPLSAEALGEIEQRTAKSWEENTFFRTWT
jgi:aryl-alcohol dehydrogenase-like predicted oxidoreductase